MAKGVLVPHRQKLKLPGFGVYSPWIIILALDSPVVISKTLGEIVVSQHVGIMVLSIFRIRRKLAENFGFIIKLHLI